MMRSVFSAFLAAFVLAACGGGGAASSDSTAPVIDGKLKSGLIVASDADAAAIVTTASTDGTGLVLSNPTGELKNLKSGQVVVLPANDSQGLPMGYTGVAQTQSDGTVKLEPASLGDVFSTLNVDFDSERDGGQIAGLIVPNGSKMSASIRSPSSAQMGVEFASCQLGVIDVKCKNGVLEGSILFENPVLLNAADGSGTKPAKIYGRIDLKKLSTKIKIDFDAVKYVSTGGVNILKAEVAGEWGASSGVKLDDATGTLVAIPAWSELIRSDASNIWTDNTKIQAGKFFELSGLNGDDKKGLMPIGGIYITLANAVRGGRPFLGELSAAQLGQIKGLGAIVWFYLDMSGNVKISGDLKLFDITGGGFDKGFKLERIDNNLTSEIIDTTLPANVYSPRVVGKIEASQTIGVNLAMDVMVAGIRPAAVKATLIGFKATGSIEGDGGLKWSPGMPGLEGNICFNLNESVFSDFVFKAAVNTKLEAGWIKSKYGYAYEYKPDPKKWWQDNFTACANTYSLPVSLIEKTVDVNDPTKTKISMSFSDAYNNAALRAQVGKWRVYEEGALQTRFFDVDTSFGGAFSAVVSPGDYKYTVVALHKSFNDSYGKPVVVVQSSPLAVTVSEQPKADFDVTAVNWDCHKIQLTSKSSPGSSGASMTNYNWTVTPVGGVAQVQAGAKMTTANFTLTNCGDVNVKHSVTDSLGGSAVSSRLVNTNLLVPAISGVTPNSATLGTATNFTITGQNLPLTSVLSIADATCQTPTNQTATGFTVVCTPGGAAGSKVVTVKTDTEANGGGVIDASKTVSVSASSSSASKIPHTGITSGQCYTAGSNALVSCASAGAIALSGAGKQDGMYADVNTMSYSGVGSYPLTSCVKDNVTGLIWEGKEASGIRAGSNTYTNWGDGRAGDASAYVAAVNAQALCGYTDWRLPTVDELQGIVDYGKSYPGPAINADMFVNTINRAYWTTSPFLGSNAWYVDFGSGYVYDLIRDSNYAVRLVHAN